MKSDDLIEVGSFEAKNRLSSLVEMAASGKRIWITKHGKRMALLSSGLDLSGDANVDLPGAFQEIRNRSGVGGESMKDLIEEGRR
jgi:prevent-host-death family protein